ncbi:MAG: hypothetical protein KGI92_07525 [Alphaproteobacteria bacterium]|nr:hypothetical protein [Alphaproteobacteria bacterium]MDE2513304.1 hypothetical protein [Alphaproteobacteria bacterium]
METGAMSLGGGGLGGVGLATTILALFYGRFLKQTLARHASVLVQKIVRDFRFANNAGRRLTDAGIGQFTD